MDVQRPIGLYQTVVVLDSTELTRDWFLRGLPFRMLRYLTENYALRVAVPASVVAEVVANHRRGTEEARTTLNRALRMYKRLGITGDPHMDAGQEYRERLAEALEVRSVEILPWPDSGHGEVTHRAVERRPPFDSQGSGYRDTLVWLSALAMAERCERVVLVSRDRVFAAKSGGLSDALVTEAVEAGVHVELVSDFGQWVVSQVPSAFHSKSLTDVAAALRDDRLMQYFMQSDFFEYLELDSDGLDLPPSMDQIGVEDVLPVYDLDRVDSKYLPDEGWLVTYEMELEVTIDADVDAEDADKWGWEHDEPDVAGRVVVSPKIVFVARIEALFDHYDDLVGFPSIQLRSREDLRLPRSIFGPSEWDVPLPFEDDREGSAPDSVLP